MFPLDDAVKLNSTLMWFKDCCIHSAHMKEEGKIVYTQNLKKNMEGIGEYTNCLKIYLQSQEINRQSHFETNTVNYFLTTSFTSSITAKCRCRDPQCLYCFVIKDNWTLWHAFNCIIIPCKLADKLVSRRANELEGTNKLANQRFTKINTKHWN